MLLDVERHLLVGHTAQKRAHNEHANHRGEDDSEHYPQAQEHRRVEADDP